MYTKMLTSKMGGELVSFKLNGEERIHQGADALDENGKVYWKRHAPVLFPVVGKLKKNQTIINGRIFEICIFAYEKTGIVCLFCELINFPRSIHILSAILLLLFLLPSSLFSPLDIVT